MYKRKISWAKSNLVRNIEMTINKGNGIFSQLRRFSNLTSKMKTTLLKTLLIPVTEYPSIPICMTPGMQRTKMQIALNKALRFINCNEYD